MSEAELPSMSKKSDCQYVSTRGSVRVNAMDWLREKRKPQRRGKERGKTTKKERKKNRKLCAREKKAVKREGKKEKKVGKPQRTCACQGTLAA